MKQTDIISELDNERLDGLLEYVPEYTEQNLKNIKSRFHAKTAKKKHRLNLKMLLAASAAAVLLAGSFVYAGVIDINRLYSIVFGGGADYISRYAEAIEGSDEHDGIRLKLLSSIKDEDKLLIFFTLTDTTGDRLSDTVDLYDSWYLDQGFGGNCRQVDYDPESKTATFLITSVGASTNTKAKLIVKSFLQSREFKYDLYEDNPELYSALFEAKSQVPEETFLSGELDGYGMGISKDSRYYDDTQFKQLRLLKPGSERISFTNIDWAFISGVAFIDNELHIQTVMKNDSYSDLVELRFIDASGKPVTTKQMSISHGDRRSETDRYEEFVFEDIKDTSQLEGLKLVMDVVEYGDYYEGNWMTEFVVPEQSIKIPLQASGKLSLRGTEIEASEIILTPLGLTIRYSYEASSTQLDNDFNDTVSVIYDDGTVIELNSISHGIDMEFATYGFSGPVIEAERVVTVSINEMQIHLDK